MKKIKVEIAGKKYTVELAETDLEHEQGLKGRDQLAADEGMLFVFEEQDTRNFWMKDTPIPIDVIFIDEELFVTAVYQGVPQSEEMMEGLCTYVLEINVNSGVKIDDELKFDPEHKRIKHSDKMLVLNSGGEVQMELEGGERIFSRNHTKTLIKFAKKAASTDNENDYRILGNRMFKFLQVQSDTEPEYVESKN